MESYGTCGFYNSWTSKAGIYAWGAEPRLYTQLMNPHPPPVFMVTGMRVGCFPYEALVSGTLECFYDSECLNNTARWVSTLPASAWPNSLDRTKPSRFYPNTSIGSLFGENMIEQVNITKNFSDYYDSCAPRYCTYTTKMRKNWIYMLTLLLGLYGGLTVALRTAAPVLIQLGRFIHRKYIKKERSQPTPQNSEQGNARNTCATEIKRYRCDLYSR